MQSANPEEANTAKEACVRALAMLGIGRRMGMGNAVRLLGAVCNTFGTRYMYACDLFLKGLRLTQATLREGWKESERMI